jgi:hypothetical protein
VAYRQVVEFQAGGASSQVFVRDLRRGRSIFTAGGLATASSGAFDVAVKPTGSLARIEILGRPFEGPVAPYSVIKREKGSDTVLDRGFDVVPDSLQLSGSTLTWMKGQTRHSAPLE